MAAKFRTKKRKFLENKAICQTQSSDTGIAIATIII